MSSVLKVEICSKFQKTIKHLVNLTWPLLLLAVLSCSHALYSVQSSNEHSALVTQVDPPDLRPVTDQPLTMQLDQRDSSPIVRMGCFEYWSGFRLPFDVRLTAQIHLNPEICVGQCESMYRGVSVVAMLQGVYCMCLAMEKFSKTRVQDTACDVECSLKVVGGGDDLNFGCGGNDVISAFCSLGADKCSDDPPRIYPPIQNSHPITGISRTSVNSVRDSRKTRCLVCSRADEYEGNCIVAEEKLGVDFSQYAYYPLNSPTACVAHCSKFNYPLALLQWTQVYAQTGDLPPETGAGSISPLFLKGMILPVCHCGSENPLAWGNWKPMEDAFCKTPCPGDPGSMCGWDNLGIEDASNFVSVYCAIEGRLCIDMGLLGGGDEGDPKSTASTESTTEEGGDPETSTTTTTTTTTEAAKNTTTKKTTTIASTTRSTPKTVETTTWPITLNTTGGSTTSKTTRSTTRSPCPILCRSVDRFNQSWAGCSGQVALKECGLPDGDSEHRGVARWKCLTSGLFEGRSPDFSNCSSLWPDDFWALFKNITNNITEPLAKETSEKILEGMERKSRASESNKIPYFGKDIAKIASLIWHLVNYTAANLEERTRLISKGRDVAGILLTYQQPWEQLAPREKSTAGSEILASLELSMFSLSQNGQQEEELSVTLSGSADLRQSEFQSTFGSVSKSAGKKKEPLIFPHGSTDTSSFIKLPEGWEDLVALDTAEFVGISLDSKFIQDILPSSSFLDLSSDNNENSSLVMNSRFLSLTIKGLDSNKYPGNTYSSNLQSRLNLTNLRGKTVTITFQHEVETGQKKRRKNSWTFQSTPGIERKIAVASPVCVFWHLEKMQWSSEGCIVLETSKTRTVCECTHLTSFALLMDSDPKHLTTTEFGLELLTFILSPLSCVGLLASTVIFSSVRGRLQQQSTKTLVTMHLTICLLVGNLALLMVVDRSYFNLPQGLCVAVGMLTHYTFLCAFGWMQIEGIHLYQMVVIVFESKRNYELTYKIGAYGLPALVVALTALIGFLGQHQTPYGGEDYCWLNGSYIWSFMGPVALVTISNTVILLVAYQRALKIKAETAILRKQQGNFKIWIRGSFSITIILGLTWIPGFFISTDSSTVSLISAYIFVILNASQGIFIFIFHCWMNDAVWLRAKRSFCNFYTPSWIPLGRNRNTTKEKQLRSQTFSSTKETSSKSWSSSTDKF